MGTSECTLGDLGVHSAKEQEPAAPGKAAKRFEWSNKCPRCFPTWRSLLTLPRAAAMEWWPWKASGEPAEGGTAVRGWGQRGEVASGCM